VLLMRGLLPAMVTHAFQSLALQSLITLVVLAVPVYVMLVIMVVLNM